MMNNQDGQTLYKEQYEHDACGIGAAISIDGAKSYSIINDALTIVEKLEHRAGKNAFCHPPRIDGHKKGDIMEWTK